MAHAGTSPAEMDEDARRRQALARIPTINPIKLGRLLIYWFPLRISQLHLNGRRDEQGRAVSNACTLICVMVCQRLNANPEIPIVYRNGTLAPEFAYFFAEIIWDGNSLHKYLLRNKMLRSLNLTVPEALDFCNDESDPVILQEWYYYQQTAPDHSAPLADRWTALIHRSIHLWNRRCPEDAISDSLYMILIADQRSVTIVYRKDKQQMMFFDSHSHFGHGAFIGFIPRACASGLRTLCRWYCKVCTEMAHQREPTTFELTFMYFRENNGSAMKQPTVLPHINGITETT